MRVRELEEFEYLLTILLKCCIYTYRDCVHSKPEWSRNLSRRQEVQCDRQAEGFWNSVNGADLTGLWPIRSHRITINESGATIAAPISRTWEPVCTRSKGREHEKNALNIVVEVITIVDETSVASWSLLILRVLSRSLSARLYVCNVLMYPFLRIAMILLMYNEIVYK